MMFDKERGSLVSLRKVERAASAQGRTMAGEQLRPENRRAHALLYAKIWFFAFFGSSAFIVPYLNVIFHRLGYSGSQLGIMGALRPFVAAASGPIWAALADRTGAHRTIFLCTFITAALLRASIGVVAEPFWYLVMVVMAMEGIGAPVSIMSDTAIISAAEDDGDYGRCRFWACLAWGVAGAVSGPMMHAFGEHIAFVAYAMGSALTLVAACKLDFSFIHHLAPECASADGACCEAEPLLPLDPQHAQHAGIAALHVHAVDVLSEPLLPEPTHVADALLVDDERSDRLHAADVLRVESVDDERSDRSHGPWSYTPESAAQHGKHKGTATPNSLDIRVSSESTSDCQRLQDVASCASQTDLEAPLTYWARLRVLLSNGAMVTLLVQGFVMGVCAGVIDGYLFVYLDDLGASPSVMGACFAVICVVELPVFMWSGELLRLLGYTRALHVVLGCFALRLGAYSVLNYAPSVWCVVPVELLHGLTFGISWSAGINLCKAMAPPGLAATAQGLFQSVYFGLGRGVGGLGAGILYEAVGPASMLRVALSFLLIAWAVVAIAQRAAFKHAPQSSLP